MNDMKSHLPLRIWLIVSVTLLISAVIVRLAWAVTYAPSAGYLFVVLAILLVTLGIYALVVYLLIKPSVKKLKSLPVRIGVTVIVTAAVISPILHFIRFVPSPEGASPLSVIIATGLLIDGIIHFVRFVPSPEAAAPLSVVIASLLLVGGIGAYLLALWVIWSVWKARES